MDFFVLGSQLESRGQRHPSRIRYEKALEFIEENLLDKFDDGMVENRKNRIYANVKLFNEKFGFKNVFYNRIYNGSIKRVERIPVKFRKYLKEGEIRPLYAQTIQGVEVVSFVKIDGHELKNKPTSKLSKI